MSCGYPQSAHDVVFGLALPCTGGSKRGVVSLIRELHVVHFAAGFALYLSLIRI